MSSLKFRAGVIVIQDQIASLERDLAEELKTLQRDRRMRDRIAASALASDPAKCVGSLVLWDELLELQEQIIEQIEQRLATEKRRLSDLQDEFADQCAEDEES